MQYEQPQSLPVPDPTSAEHSARVRHHLQEKISMSGGMISFAEYMQEVLYAPGLGYYSAGATKFGAAGDFVTAPEVSSVFGRVLARQIAEVLVAIGGGHILEYGAGSGKLAIDVLLALQEMDALPLSYQILEVAADLKERQQRRIQEELPALSEHIRWVTNRPTNFQGVILANEVLDAMPVERFVQEASGISQLCVANHGDDFAGRDFEWVGRPATEPLFAAVSAIESDMGEPLREGYLSEVSLATRNWVTELADSLDQGVAFLFDYGVSRREYYAADRNDGWLRCHYRHHAHSNPFVYPGIQDITCWVDFSAVADAAVTAGLEVLGYAAQAHFLMGAGLELEMQSFDQLPTDEQIALSGQVKTLILPGEMGENFKCMAIGRGMSSAPSAFNTADRTHTL